MSDAPHVSPQLWPSKPAVNVEGFFRAVGDAQKDYLDRFQIDPSVRPLYTEEWPKERLAEVGKPFDFIGFHVVRSQRASESNTEYKAFNGLRLAEQLPSEREAGYLNENYLWKEEAVVSRMQVQDPAGAGQPMRQAHHRAIRFRADPVAEYHVKRTVAGRPDDHNAS